MPLARLPATGVMKPVSRIVPLVVAVAAASASADPTTVPAAAPAGPFPAAVSGVRNVTVYRLTPSNYTGLSDLDSGDLAGDLGFGLWELLMPMSCREDPTSEIGCQRGTGRFIDAPARTSPSSS